MKAERRLIWFRLYTEVIGDIKVQSLPNETFKFWINCLCVARMHDGILPELDQIAFLLRMRKSTAQSQFQRLIDAGLIDSTEKGYVPHAWDRRQYESDNSTARVERFRESKRNVTRNVTSNVAGNGVVTSRARVFRVQNTDNTPLIPLSKRGADDLAQDLYDLWPEKRASALKTVQDELVKILATSGPNLESDMDRILANARSYIDELEDEQFCLGLRKWLAEGGWQKAGKPKKQWPPPGAIMGEW